MKPLTPWLDLKREPNGRFIVSEKAKCSVVTCQRTIQSLGMCNMHYMRVRRHGDYEKVKARSIATKEQLIERGFIKPVRNAECHPDRKHTGRGLCASCYQMAWQREHPEKSGSAWLKRHPEEARFHQRKNGLKSRHGITWEFYENLFKSQSGKCANSRCGKVFTLDAAQDHRRTCQIDHDHRTGKIRGLLCKGCNATLGHIADDMDRLRGLIEYLYKHDSFELAP